MNLGGGPFINDPLNGQNPVEINSVGRVAVTITVDTADALPDDGSFPYRLCILYVILPN
jgi:hypothetical protein